MRVWVESLVKFEPDRKEGRTAGRQAGRKAGKSSDLNHHHPRHFSINHKEFDIDRLPWVYIIKNHRVEWDGHPCNLENSLNLMTMYDNDSD